MDLDSVSQLRCHCTLVKLTWIGDMSAYSHVPKDDGRGGAATYSEIGSNHHLPLKCVSVVPLVIYGSRLAYRWEWGTPRDPPTSPLTAGFGFEFKKEC
mmetsp:Transcript_44391/g.79595  ORF Transcript_44391/g.79595 Transcript_44391/m.79595 type:complete len:98 (+) Transcript_44391:274-567(+)